MTPLRLLVLGDPHFKRDNVVRTTQMAASFLKLVDELKPDAVINLGDTLDRFELLHQDPLNQATNFFYDIADRCPLYVLIGNHDRNNDDVFLEEKNPFIGLKRTTAPIKIIPKVLVETIKGLKFIFVPYVSKGRFAEALNTGGPDLPSLLEGVTTVFAHQEFKGAVSEPFVSVDGDHWPLEYPLVISGHIHKRQVVQKNIMYPGIPIQQIRGDDEYKVVTLMTFDSSGLLEQQTYDLGLIKMVEIRVTAAEFTSFVPPTGKDVILRVSGTEAEIKVIERLNEYKLWKEMGIKIIAERHSVDVVGALDWDYNQKDIRESLFNRIKQEPDLVEEFNLVLGFLKQTDLSFIPPLDLIPAIETDTDGPSIPPM